ncbi:acetate kinase [Mesoplasma coleopterae]|uniref:Acetate kinase n=1 Tax=Mesoplasma coleopterae TaxID=324078 RepID=A0A2K8P351_9MOLU|nr:acetate kinase [Mesoplasma coleopterae]ATZ20570.1 acetate kinase [Mesoplasma coleopterae]AVN62091.1 acetate kinase [Mesoplasma coleopterae]AVN62756.1 acetate kinase [Mesoplasma coleopterae]
MILVVNAGSSSIKFRLFNDLDKNNPIDILDGLAERITVDGAVSFKYEGKKYEYNVELPNHEVAIKFILDKLIELNIISNVDDINAVGFRVVHGGTISKSSIIDQKVFDTIKDAVKLAPLHNPGAITAIEAIEKVMPKAKLVACFDTAYHQTLAEEQYLYAVPYSWYKEHGVRKYGFHGISYQYIAEKMSEVLNKPKDKLNLIVCHLGNGASITCIKNGKSFDTTMGLTPLAGVMMGTRSGDIDPSIIEYMCKELKTDVSKITNILNKESGLLGLSGKSSDMRDVTGGYFKGDEDYKRALNKYTQVAADYIIRFANLLGRDIDGIVFTAGVGENSIHTRQFILEKLPLLDIKIDTAKNDESYGDYKYISSADSKIKVLAVRTNEELMICKDTINLTK